MQYVVFLEAIQGSKAVCSISGDHTVLKQCAIHSDFHVIFQFFCFVQVSIVPGCQQSNIANGLLWWMILYSFSYCSFYSKFMLMFICNQNIHSLISQVDPCPFTHLMPEPCTISGALRVAQLSKVRQVLEPQVLKHAEYSYLFIKK